jgi:predicted transcriptional regulator
MYNGEDAFDNRSRKLIYNYILTNPGVSFGIIKDFFDMKYSTLMYHLNYLEKSDKVVSKREGRQRCYYSRRTGKIPQSILQRPSRLNLNDSQKQILKFIRANPGISKKQLMIRSKLKKKKLEYNLKRLKDLKVIWLVNRNDIVGYEYITREELMDEVFNRLVSKLLSDEIDEDKFLQMIRKLDELEDDEE